MKNNHTWSQGLKRQELYDACWIMGNIPERAKQIEQNPVWSFLPIRYYNFGLWEYAENIHLSSVGLFENGVELCRSSSLCSSLGHFARLLWEKAAEMITREYPDIMDVKFGPQEDDGIYPIQFRYDIEKIAVAQRRIMCGLIRDGFSIDEYINVEKIEENERQIKCHYYGVVGVSFEELQSVFYGTRHGESLPIVTKKNVQFSYNECEEYYKTFDARMLTLGNQRRAYKFFEHQNQDLFEAVQTGNKDKIKRMVIGGRSLNEISPSGDTAFSLLLRYMIHSSKTHDISKADEQFLDFLLSHHANVNLIGVDECADPPLFEVFIEHAEYLVKWLLEHGADLKAEVCYDDYIDKDSSITIQDWINERNDNEED